MWSSNANSFVYTCTVKNQPIYTTDVVFQEKPENKRVKRVALNDKQIQQLPRDIGKSFPGITELTAGSSSLKSLNPGSFQEMPFLKHLDLSYNELTKIPSGTFDDLSSLQTLNLKRNQIDNFNVPKIPTLRELSLEGNNLKYLSPKTFSNLPQLSNLDLANNQLPTIDESVFKSNPKLREVSLASNKIQSMSSQVFEGLNELQSIDLTKNDCIDSMFAHDTIQLMQQELEEKCSSCGNLKVQLANCKRDKEDSWKSAPKKFESLRKENEKLRSLLKVNLKSFNLKNLIKMCIFN